MALLLWRLTALRHAQGKLVTAFEWETMIHALGDSEEEWGKAEETRKKMAAIAFLPRSDQPQIYTD
jgi:hypothetical protein